MTLPDDMPTKDLRFPRFGTIRAGELARAYPTIWHVTRATDHELALVRDIGPGLVKVLRRVIAEGK